jgi:hypothetical protein
MVHAGEAYNQESSLGGYKLKASVLPDCHGGERLGLTEALEMDMRFSHRVPLATQQGPEKDRLLSRCVLFSLQECEIVALNVFLK